MDATRALLDSLMGKDSQRHAKDAVAAVISIASTATQHVLWM